MARRFPINLADDELRKFLLDVDRSINPASLITSIYKEATLSSDLQSGGTQVIGGVTYNGKAIRSGRKLSSGTNIGAIYNGTDYTVIWANACDEAI